MAHRILVVFVLLAAIGGCLVWYGTLGPAPTAGVPPGDEDVLSSATEFVGEEVLVSGTVVETDPLTVEISADGHTGSVVIEQSTTMGVTGDTLVVYGDLVAEDRIAARSVVHKSAGDYRRTLVVSAVAGLWVLLRSLRHWRLEPRKLRVVRRTAKERGGE